MTDVNTLYVLLESAIGYTLFEVISFEEIGIMLQNDIVSIADSIMDMKRFGRSVKLHAFYSFQNSNEALENAKAISEHTMTQELRHFLELNIPKVDDDNTKKKKKKKGKKENSNSSSSSSFALGVIDPSLANSIVDEIGDHITCRSDDTVREIIRGCRLHHDTYIKGLAAVSNNKSTSTTMDVDDDHDDHDGGGITTSSFSSSSSTQQHQQQQRNAQLGLGHSLSRSRIKYNPARSDNMIIQSIALLDQLDKDCNTFIMRIREWYSYHFPELKHIVKDAVQYAKCATYIQDKRTLFTNNNNTKNKKNHAKKAKKKSSSSDDDDDDDSSSSSKPDDNDEKEKDDKLFGLSKILNDDLDMANNVITAARTSMGMDCSTLDMLNICNFTNRMIHLMEYRKHLQQYLSNKMNIVAPNLSTLIGDTVAARLISKAGSLTALAKVPASTMQILGAEKALFRALKTKGNTPKYGLIYHSTFIGRADSKNKGRISRYLANKCSIATRIDSFSDETPTSLYGQKLRDQVEERLRFYETGQSPRKNIDVMEEIAKEIKGGSSYKNNNSNNNNKDDDDDDDDKKDKKKKKKKKKSKKDDHDDEMEDDDDDKDDDDDDDDEEEEDDDEDEEEEDKARKDKKKQKKEKKKKKEAKKKKNKKEKAAVGNDDEKQSNKKKRKSLENNDDDDNDDDDKKKKKKKRKSKGNDDDDDE